MATEGRFARALLLCLLPSMALVAPLLAAPVSLSANAWASFCQTSFSVSSSVDGSFASGLNGWAIDPNEGTNQVAVYQALADVANPGGTSLTFELHTLHVGALHNLGRFRLAVTGDDRGLYGQGSECPNPTAEGTATWTVLAPVSVQSANGQTLTVQGDGSVLASGTNPNNDVVTVVAETALTRVTGFRLEALTDASLPSNGPGRNTNGNFVLTELTIDQAPIVLATAPAAGTGALVVMVLALSAVGALLLRKAL